eukprot:tig00021281_g19938.t1
MGGNALRSGPTRRLPNAEYLELVAELIALLRPLFRRVNVLPHIRCKVDHGDIDLLVSEPAQHASYDAAVPEVARLLDAKEYVKNDSTVSFEFRGAQVDIKYIEPAEYEMHLTYKSYGDLGNIMGTIAHHVGLTYGSEGLWIKFGDSDLPRVDLTSDPRACFEFLGFDYDRFARGFDSYEEAFDFVTASPLFDPKAYDCAALNHENRRRQFKRPMFARFLAWLRARAEAGAPYAPSGSPRPRLNFCPAGCSMVDWALRRFGKEELVKEAARRRAERRAMAARFNGTLLRSVTGLTGKPLGSLLEELRALPGLAEAVRADAAAGGGTDAAVRAFVEAEWARRRPA